MKSRNEITKLLLELRLTLILAGCYAPSLLGNAELGDVFWPCYCSPQVRFS